VPYSGKHSSPASRTRAIRANVRTAARSPGKHSSHTIDGVTDKSCIAPAQALALTSAPPFMPPSPDQQQEQRGRRSYSAANATAKRRTNQIAACTERQTMFEQHDQQWNRGIDAQLLQLLGTTVDPAKPIISSSGADETNLWVECCRTLGGMGREGGAQAEALADVLTWCKEPRVRVAACEALGKLGGEIPETLAPVAHRAVHGRLGAAQFNLGWGLQAPLSDDDARVRAAACSALSAFGPALGVGSVVRALDAVEGYRQCVHELAQTDASMEVRDAAEQAERWLRVVMQNIEKTEAEESMA